MQTHPFFSPGPGGESLGPQALAKAVPALATVIASTISIATVSIKIMRFTIFTSFLVLSLLHSPPFFKTKPTTYHGRGKLKKKEQSLL